MVRQQWKYAWLLFGDSPVGYLIEGWFSKRECGKMNCGTSSSLSRSGLADRSEQTSWSALAFNNRHDRLTSALMCISWNVSGEVALTEGTGTFCHTHNGHFLMNCPRFFFFLLQSSCLSTNWAPVWTIYAFIWAFLTYRLALIWSTLDHQLKSTTQQSGKFLDAEKWAK